MNATLEHEVRGEHLPCVVAYLVRIASPCIPATVCFRLGLLMLLCLSFVDLTSTYNALDASRSFVDAFMSCWQHPAHPHAPLVSGTDGSLRPRRRS